MADPESASESLDEMFFEMVGTLRIEQQTPVSAWHHETPDTEVFGGSRNTLLVGLAGRLVNPDLAQWILRLGKTIGVGSAVKLDPDEFDDPD